MKYRQFDTDLWNREYTYGLSDKEFRAYVFLFTNERVNMCGIYRLTDRYAMFHLDINKMELEGLKKKFETDRKYFFFREWVFLPENDKHSKYSTNKYVVGKYVEEFNKIPSVVREYFLETLSLPYTPPFDLSKVSLSLNKKREMVKEIEREREKWAGTREGTRDGLELNEDIDPNSIPDNI